MTSTTLADLNKFLASEDEAKAAAAKAANDAHKAYMQSMVDRAMAAFDATRPR